MLMGSIAEPAHRSFAFGPFVLIPERQLLTAHGERAPVGGRALDILVALVERCGELVNKRELIARAWPDTHVDESNLKVNIAALRKVLGEPADAPRYIATVTGRGYRFVAPVRVAGPGKATTPLAETRSCRRDVVGRTREIDALCADLEAARLVSIVGPGGIGKSTVALAVAEQLEGDGAEVCIVDLASLEEGARVPRTIAAAVGFQSPSQDSVNDLCDGLQGRRMLLVIDNCEHLTEAVAACADRILAAASGVTILAVGREALQLRGERVRRLGPLEAPPASEADSPAKAMAFSAVQFFVECARRQHRAFEVDDANASVVAELCRRLDGLPLAIELAAARLEAFGEHELLGLLDNGLDLLRGPRAGLERRGTLAAALDWSFNRLSDDERSIMGRLATFDSAFSLEAAWRAIGEHYDRASAVEHLTNLVAKSLIVAERRAGRFEYRLFQTTRAYARERLMEAGVPLARPMAHDRSDVGREGPNPPRPGAAGPPGPDSDAALTKMNRRRHEPAQAVPGFTAAYQT